jgi:hypothetical protein
MEASSLGESQSVYSSTMPYLVRQGKMIKVLILRQSYDYRQRHPAITTLRPGFQSAKAADEPIEKSAQTVSGPSVLPSAS